MQWSCIKNKEFNMSDNDQIKDLLRLLIDKVDSNSKEPSDAILESYDDLEAVIPSNTITEMEDFMGYRIILMGMT
jgi:hypothetical protein